MSVFIAPQEKIRALVYATLRSLSNVLMSAGINSRDFVELAKAAYVDEATAKYGAPGKPASMAKVSRETGLSRPEVKRLRDKYERFEQVARVIALTREGTVLGRWFTDPRYMDNHGAPLPLRAGPGEGTIAEMVAAAKAPELMKQVNPNETFESVIERMLETGHIREIEDGLYVPLQRNYSSTNDLEGIAIALDTSVVRGAKTIKYNLTAKSNQTWIQRMVSSDRGLSKAELSLIRRSVRARATSFCEEVDDLIAAASSRSRVEEEGDQHDIRKPGIGVFYFEDEYF